MHDMMCGKLLGDGCMTKQGTRKPRFQFTHCLKDKGWSEHCYKELSRYIPLNSPKYRRIKDSRVVAGFTESYIVQSRTSEELCNLYDLWYPDSKKKLPFLYIQEHFTDKSLAWWYQDDGHLKQQGGILKKIILSTDSFSSTENQFLTDFLQKKYGLTFSRDKQNRLLLYDQFQINFFLRIINPYIHESMNRKQRIPFTPKKIASRTTIYLPSELIFSKPTIEINQHYSKLPLLLSLEENHTAFFMRFKSDEFFNSTVRAYQINISEEDREKLGQLKYKTGLTISQLTWYCFRL